MTRQDSKLKIRELLFAKNFSPRLKSEMKAKNISPAMR